MKVFIIRHTSVKLNGEVTCYGFTDVDVKDSFEEEAIETKKRLEGLHFDAVFSSPLQRARKLAEFCGYEDIIYDDRLKEMNFGDWEGRPWLEIIKGEDTETFFKRHINEAVPNGESQAMHLARIQAFIQEKKAEGYEQIAIFCHGGVINCARTLAGLCELEEAFATIPDFGSVTELVF